MNSSSQGSAHVHVPTPGESVSAATGSAVVTVCKALAACQIDRGGSAALVVRDEVEHEGAGVPLIRVPMADKVWRTRSEKAVDLAVGALTARAPRTEAVWRPVFDALAAQSAGEVFLHNAPAAVEALLGSPLRPIAYLHNEVLRGWPAWRRRRLAAKAPVIAVSEFVARRGFGDRLVDEQRVLSLTNGVDTAAFRPAPAAVEPTIVFVGKVAPHKGAHLLLAAADRLAAHGLSFRVMIVGSGDLAAQGTLTTYERSLRELAVGLGDRVAFVPFVRRSELPDTYRQGTIMVVPSDWDEPCSLTLAEAMASGLACVASNRGGLPEAGGDAVLYFDPQDPASLVRHLERLLVDDAMRAELASKARQHALEHNWERQFDTMLSWLGSWEPR